MSHVASPGDTVSVAGLSRKLMRRTYYALILTVLGYGGFLFYVDADAMWANLSVFSTHALLEGTALSLASFGVRFVRWAYYLKVLKLRVPLWPSAVIFTSGFAMSITPAKMGEVLKALMLRERYDMAVSRTGPIVLAERFTDVGALLLLGGIGLLDLPHGKLIAGVATACVLAGGAVVSSRVMGQWVIVQLTRSSRMLRLREGLLNAHGALRELLQPATFAVGTLLSILAWGLQGVALLDVANDSPGVSMDLAGSMLAYCAPLLAGTLAMLPGGLGLTEASMAGVIVRFGGASVAAAAAITIIVRVITFWIAILLGGVALVLYKLGDPRSAERSEDGA